MRYSSLQYLRAIAALAVVYFHASLQVALLAQDGSRFAVTGDWGVDVFFVLSGFVMWTAHPPGKRTGRIDFYKRRVVRVVPLYWMVTLAASAIVLVAPSLMRSTKLSPDHLLASMLFVPWPNPAFGPGDANYLTPVIIPGWTLEFEMLFYLVFGLVLTMTTRARFTILVGLFGALLLLPWFALADMDRLRFYGSGYLFEFLFGAFAALVASRLPPSNSLSTTLVVVGGAVLVLFVNFAPEAPHFVTRGIGTTLIMLGIVSFERLGRVPHVGFLSLLGDASYSIYLVHGFALAALRAVWVRLSIPTDFPGQASYMGLALVGGAAVGIACHRLIETPMLRVGRRWTGPGAPQPAAV